MSRRQLFPPLALAVLLLPGAASGQDMSRKDRLALLYSNQVIFDRRGEPLVSVRVTEGQDKVRFSSAGPLTLLPGADDGSRVRSPAGASWTVTLAESRPADVRWWIAAERLPAGDLDRAAESRKRWQAQGHEVMVIEGGALLGISGRTLDTRVLTLAVDPQPTEAAAQARALELAAAGPLLGEVVAEPKSRAGGWLVAKEERSGIEVRALDLLWISPAPDATVDVADVEFGRGSPHHGKADRRYAGDVYLAVGADGRLAVVNLASAETLLTGVVPSELMPASPEEALKAQAIAARGQLLAKVGTRHRSDPYLLCADTHCQVYGGQGKEHPRTTAAVEATRGQLLFDERGLVDTVYSSTCGGHTESFVETWGGSPNATLEGIADAPGGPSPITEAAVAGYLDSPPPGAWCAVSGGNAKTFRWTATRSVADVNKAVNALARIGDVSELRVVRRGRSGRAMAVEYVGAKGKHTVRGEYANRRLLGNLRSGLWVVERAGAEWRFRGGGFGHGVGMCQHGSIGMALAAKDYRAILLHYYPGSRLQSGW